MARAGSPADAASAALDPDLHETLFGPRQLPFSITLVFPPFDGPNYERAIEKARASAEYLPPWARGPWDRHLRAIEGQTSEPRWSFVPVFRPGVFADRRIDADEAGAILAASGASLAIVAAAEDRGAEFDDTRRVLERVAGTPVAAVTPFDPDHAGLNGSGYELSYFALERVLASEQWGPPLLWFALPTAR